MDEQLQFLSTLGVGGLIAGIIFMFYRKDVRSYTDLWKQQSELLFDVVQENTRSNEAIIRLLESMTGRNAHHGETRKQ